MLIQPRPSDDDIIIPVSAGQAFGAVQLLRYLAERANDQGIVERFTLARTATDLGLGVESGRRTVRNWLRQLEALGYAEQVDLTSGWRGGRIVLTSRGRAREVVSGPRAVERARSREVVSGPRAVERARSREVARGTPLSFVQKSFERDEGESGSHQKAKSEGRHRGEELLETLAYHLAPSLQHALWSPGQQGGRIKLQKLLERVESALDLSPEQLAAELLDMGPIPADQASPVGILLWRGERLVHRRRSGPPPVPPADRPGDRARPGAAGAERTLPDESPATEDPPPIGAAVEPQVVAGAVGALAERLRSLTPACSALAFGKET